MLFLLVCIVCFVVCFVKSCFVSPITIQAVDERVYWHPDSAMPVAAVTLRLHVTCEICRDHFVEEEGIRCGNKHFVCWRECFDGYVRSAGEADGVSRCLDKEGNLRCPGEKCSESFDVALAARCHAPVRVLEALARLRTDITLQRLLPALLEGQKHRLTEEFARIQQIQDVDLRLASVLRLEIVEQILCLRCPKCKSVFSDFEGCFALTCHQSCSAGFCAWCLTDCGVSAHEHVLICSESKNPNSYYGTLPEFNEHHRQRRSRLVRERIERESSAAVRKFAWQLLYQELSDLRLDIPEDVRAAAAPAPAPAAAPRNPIWQLW